MLAYFLYLVDQGSDIEELVTSEVGAVSHSGCRSRLYSTVQCADASLHFGLGQVHNRFQRTTDVRSLSIVDKANIRHHKACAVYVCPEGLLIVRSVRRGFFELGLQIAAWVIWRHQVAEKVGSLPSLPLPRIFVFIFDGIPDENFPRPARLDTCFVQHWKGRVCAARLFSTSPSDNHGGCRNGWRR